MENSGECVFWLAAAGGILASASIGSDTVAVAIAALLVLKGQGRLIGLLLELGASRTLMLLLLLRQRRGVLLLLLMLLLRLRHIDAVGVRWMIEAQGPSGMVLGALLNCTLVRIEREWSVEALARIGIVGLMCECVDGRCPCMHIKTLRGVFVGDDQSDFPGKQCLQERRRRKQAWGRLRPMAVGDKWTSCCRARHSLAWTSRGRRRAVT